ncbi:hypothetical protein GCM10011348_31710 [Marinobacterium nitratireducens]|uniref:DUF2092 domain-containing protein n=1 Tax=Marinobacterium nitratireducens TaxID=518897 RepID=A0A918DV80_9GAMM|nr:DUF2092 domain-containing protein [Marinobacterium nitratireducens]GGO84755.1 hypothetical protein GCM10011348_31710 [Marinobacterium nitratireducens]
MMLRLTAMAALAVASTPLQAAPDIPEGQVVIDSAAEAVLLDACAWLRDAQSFSVQVDIGFDEITTDGARVEYHRQDVVALNRPNHLRIEVEGDQGRRSVYYDGEQVTLYRPGSGYYTRIDAPDSLDATLDMVLNSGIEMPLSDMFYSHPCAGIADHLRTATYGGLHFLGGDRYHHLLLTTDAVDVQMWVANDEVPSIRKVVIAYSRELGTPQYRALFSNWNFAPNIADDIFRFEPSDGDREVPFRAAATDPEEAEQ